MSNYAIKPHADYYLEQWAKERLPQDASWCEIGGDGHLSHRLKKILKKGNGRVLSSGLYAGYSDSIGTGACAADYIFFNWTMEKLAKNFPEVCRRLFCALRLASTSVIIQTELVQAHEFYDSWQDVVDSETQDPSTDTKLSYPQWLRLFAHLGTEVEHSRISDGDGNLRVLIVLKAIGQQKRAADDNEQGAEEEQRSALDETTIYQGTASEVIREMAHNVDTDLAQQELKSFLALTLSSLAEEISHCAGKMEEATWDRKVAELPENDPIEFERLQLTGALGPGCVRMLGAFYENEFNRVRVNRRVLPHQSVAREGQHNYDPVHYYDEVDVEENNPDASGYDKSGWYFFEKDWKTVQGPFAERLAAQTACGRYTWESSYDAADKSVAEAQQNEAKIIEVKTVVLRRKPTGDPAWQYLADGSWTGPYRNVEEAVTGCLKKASYNEPGAIPLTVKYKGQYYLRAAVAGEHEARADLFGPTSVQPDQPSTDSISYEDMVRRLDRDPQFIADAPRRAESGVDAPRDPVHLFELEGSLTEGQSMAGYTESGWYFFNEVWVDAYGPFSSEEEARAALLEYGNHLEAQAKKQEASLQELRALAEEGAVDRSQNLDPTHAPTMPPASHSPTLPSAPPTEVPPEDAPPPSRPTVPDAAKPVPKPEPESPVKKRARPARKPKKKNKG